MVDVGRLMAVFFFSVGLIWLNMEVVRDPDISNDLVLFDLIGLGSLIAGVYGLASIVWSIVRIPDRD